MTDAAEGAGDTTRPRVAVFRPDDERAARAAERLRSLDLHPVVDPMLAVEPTDALPEDDADVVVLTSKTGVDLVADRDWTPGDATVAAIGEPTAAALRDAGYEVDVVPETYSSSGLVQALSDRVAGRRVEVARSDHGSDVLLEGLADAGADVHETVLYELRRPEAAGESTELAAAGEIDAALFTSSLTVEHFFEAASERGVRDAAVAGLGDAVVGTIGEPTAETATEHGIDVDVVPATADFGALAEAVASELGR